MQKVILHIGSHKTGTTSIQKFMSSISEDLLSEGVLYPVAGRSLGSDKKGRAHHLLAWSILGKNNVHDEQCWLDLKREIDRSNPKMVVLSSEDFEGCTSKQVRKIKGHLCAFDVKIVVYLRNPLDYIVSAYKECVKSGRCHRAIDAFVDNRIEKCDYGLLLSSWANSFGADHIEVRIFDKVKREPGVIADFGELFGISKVHYASYVSHSKHVNVSPSDEVVALIRWINMIEYCASRRVFKKVFHGLRRNVLREARFGKMLLMLYRPFSSELNREYIRSRLKQAESTWKSEVLDTYIADSDRGYLEL